MRKKWRILKRFDLGGEWFYPQKRFLWFFYTGFTRVLEPCVDIRFREERDAILWIQKVIREESLVNDKSYSYPVE